MKKIASELGKVFVEKSIYDPLSISDGIRILVMRMWPRGVKKSKINLWMKELGTQKDLIKRWKTGDLSLEEFKSTYLSDLRKDFAAQERVAEVISHLVKGEDVTLLCVEKDSSKCHRSFLKDLLDERLNLTVRMKAR